MVECVWMVELYDTAGSKQYHHGFFLSTIHMGWNIDLLINLSNKIHSGHTLLLKFNLSPLPSMENRRSFQNYYIITRYEILRVSCCCCFYCYFYCTLYLIRSDGLWNKNEKIRNTQVYAKKSEIESCLNETNCHHWQMAQRNSKIELLTISFPTSISNIMIDLLLYKAIIYKQWSR